VVAIATLGIAATLLAYAISPGVRHAVSHAAHSVRHAVGNVIDKDAGGHRAKPPRAPQAGHPGKPTSKGATIKTTTTSR
jgi:hypothetical protein